MVNSRYSFLNFGNIFLWIFFSSSDGKAPSDIIRRIFRGIPVKRSFSDRLPIHHYSGRPFRCPQYHNDTALDCDLRSDVGVIALHFYDHRRSPRWPHLHLSSVYSPDHHHHHRSLLRLHLPLGCHGTLRRQHHPATEGGESESALYVRSCLRDFYPLLDLSVGELGLS